MRSRSRPNAACETLEARSLFAAGTITGVLYNDDNGSQAKEGGETLNPGRTVFIDANLNSKLDAGEKSTTTNAQGRYTFSGLEPGTYKVTRVLPSDAYLITTDAARKGVGVTVTSGGTTTLDIGSTTRALVEFEVQVDGHSANAQAYVDNNKNGVYDSGDLLATKVGGTSEYTNYSVAVKPGVQRISVTAPAGTYRTNRFEGYEDLDVVAANPYLISFRFTAAAPSATLTGILFNDDNGNTQKDANETLNVGRTVFLDTNDNGKLDAGEKSTTTDSTGRYTFTKLTAGEYHVSRVLPSGYQITTGDESTFLFSNSDPYGYDVNIGSTARAIVQGVVYYTNTPPVNGPDQGPEIDGETIYADLNKNGKLDSNEPSFVSGQIQYDRPDGDYRLVLAPGTYRIRAVDTNLKPSGYSGLFADVTLKAGELLDIDFTKPFGTVA